MNDDTPTAKLDPALAKLTECQGAMQKCLETTQKAWEEALNGLGDDAQLSNVDLQNILQKQQQTLQMMSNISKTLWDTAQSVIRKIGG